MATRDYVKRGRRPRKPIQRRKTPTENQLFFKRKIMLSVAILVIGFTFFIYRLSTREVAAPAPSVPVKVQPQVKPKNTEESLPPVVTERWSYFETLENKSVEVEANEQELSDRPYLMQCGAYKVAEYAEVRKAKIALQGIESQVRTTETEGGTWYRVVLGPYDLKRKAESDRNLLRRAGVEPCKIWFWEE